MKSEYLTPRHQRTRIWLVVCLLFASISLVTRLLLLIKSWQAVDVSIIHIAGIFLVGFAYDIVTAMYFTIPLAFYLWLIPDRLFVKRWHRYFLWGWLVILSAILTINAAAEYLFWDEFTSRFNFIAVDYLVYTTEVIGNINQSYPMTWIACGVIGVAIIISVGTARALKHENSLTFAFKQRSKQFALYVSILFVCYFGVTNQYRQFSKNTYANELAGNGMYELFAAYFNNQLEYDRFYKSITDHQAFDVVQNMMNSNEVQWVNNQQLGIERTISNEGKEKRMNVVLISVESFSADFMASFGNQKNITPFMDSLARHSLFFTKLYATGTRTVRGLEALSLCVPPTPGQSIVRRPSNEHLFSLGRVFRDKGYACEYIYGGYGYFDNMNYFFANNEYDVIDRTALQDKEIHYENIWGVADEDLFTMAERQIDTASQEHPVFAHIMTTSNHRPFTYPDGRIDIPSHTGRDGAVKYTDYAIGNFIKRAAAKPWFQNTIFVIVADHCASSAGKTQLPVNKYHIPMLIYSPGNIQPAVMDRLMSQIDIGPTLLGMMNFSYTSKFFGYDIFKLKPGNERAFISTYQNLGYLKNDKLVILSPRNYVSSFQLSDKQEPIREISDASLEKEAIAWYQSASYSFKHGLMKQEPKQALE
jgi:phosphoglycerol transferase MdoB-like AlkP superfamily enzyme